MHSKPWSDYSSPSLVLTQEKNLVFTALSSEQYGLCTVQKFGVSTIFIYFFIKKDIQLIKKYQ